MLNFQCKRRNPDFSFLIFHFLFLILLSSCSVQKQIAKSADKNVLDIAALQTAHVGISIYEPATSNYWYDYQGDKYFVPASNTKIPTCYAAMKYLGDSLVGLRYSDSREYIDIFVRPSGDPTFLHPDFEKQPVYDFFKTSKRRIEIVTDNWKEDALGNGWSWDDYNEPYMCEKNPMPIYGNVLKFAKSDKGLKVSPNHEDILLSVFDLIDDKMSLLDTSIHQYYIDSLPKQYYIKREKDNNFFRLLKSQKELLSQSVPFIPVDSFIVALLRDTLKESRFGDYFHSSIKPDNIFNDSKVIYSQPTDSLLKPMMHRSDNFFAEQSLLMVSNERLGIMIDEKIIDTILKTDFKDLPQKPGWVDGSGLSRYNLFTPQDLVVILNKMKNEFGMERIKVIFPTGGRGTLTDYYIADSNYVYAKTGTLSGVVAISGYLYTKKGKQLIFSVLVNNHQASGTEVRRAVEKFIQGIRNKY